MVCVISFCSNSGGLTKILNLSELRRSRRISRFITVLYLLWFFCKLLIKSMYHQIINHSSNKLKKIQPLTEEQGFELSQMVEPDSVGEIEPLNSRLAGNVMEHSFSTLLQEQEKTESTASEDSLDLVREDECASAEETRTRKWSLIFITFFSSFL